MSRPKDPVPTKPDAATLHVVHPHAAAVDVHSDTHVACVGPDQVRTFGTYSADLRALADWFADAGVATVVLESTGVYWIPLFELLEARGFEVLPHRAGPATAALAPRPTASTASGSNACTHMGSCGRRSGRPTRCSPCAAAGGKGRCWFGTPRTTCNICRKRWNK